MISLSHYLPFGIILFDRLSNDCTEQEQLLFRMNLRKSALSRAGGLSDETLNPY